VSGLTVLLDQLAAAQRQAQSADERALSLGAATGRSESDESIRRTLVLAQRAADLVVSEAKSVADKIVADAREQAARLMTTTQQDAERARLDAESAAAQIIRESEATAERLTATRAAELQHELSGLVEEQGRRRFELDQLRQHVDATRAQLRADLQAQMQRLDTMSAPPLDVTNPPAG
jgi:cell division septum initiation protein DivIVA